MHISTGNSSSNKEGKSELDSHADMCVAVATWKDMEYTGVVCGIYPCSNSHKPSMQVPVVKQFQHTIIKLVKYLSYCCHKL
jgi:hypothetical protein